MPEFVPGQDLSFEEALNQLEELVAQLEAGRLPLAEAVDYYEQGMALASYCGDLLDNAELRIRQLDHAEADDTGDEYDLEAEINHLLFDPE